ncbi:thioredoxin family protein [Carboxylicivirga sp. A043]|uniref:thioredoxin family protein n=1 Tax=Carboxylicivirga litoralis TaxID=2816963 RepID=UPI0021CB8203|nr:thioredoxin family protein [Carboxylicivirga sp. A043]MCU4155850.1 thioredoxin family protein [Carboxylicivirga sp. A043]
MKKIYSILTLMALPVLLMAQGIHFEHGTFNEALAKAKKENKLLFIDGYAVWCGPCKKMAKTVFLEEEVGKYFDEHFVAIKVDVERGEGPTIKRKYGISGLPGYVIVDGDDNVIYRFSGSMPTERFLENLETARVNNSNSNNIAALAQRYTQEYEDEQFVRLYLNKLKESNSTGYTDVLEQYLKIQTNISESSKEMVELLANHNEQIIYGGKADEIIQRNYGSDAWKLYVRKDIREIFQKLPRKMVETSTNYAVAKKDTVMLELVLSRAGEAGVKVDEQQRKRTYTFFYLQTGQGEKYKAMVHDDNEAYISSIDVDELRSYYLEWQIRCKEGDRRALSQKPFSMRRSQEISSMVYSYAQFANTKEDKETVTRWMKVAYDIIPGDSKIMSQYASVLYLYGDNKEEAIKIMEEAYQAAVESESKNEDGIKADLALMKANKQIILK